ncbi:MAG: hypothetical protein NPIRA01_40060 [Nitrospirales bacterium]|nr:MAG: hypothetical protein NPIRA01_40060 [Nitrospirales bacterium]
MSKMQAVSFQQITKILELTDELNLSREWVEIPLSPESPGSVKKLPNGKLEVVVDADIPFDEWFPTIQEKIQAVMQE